MQSLNIEKCEREKNQFCKHTYQDFALFVANSYKKLTHLDGIFQIKIGIMEEYFLWSSGKHWAKILDP